MMTCTSIGLRLRKIVIFAATTSSRLILIRSFKALMFFVAATSIVKISSSGSPRTRQLTSRILDMMRGLRWRRLYSRVCTWVQR